MSEMLLPLRRLCEQVGFEVIVMADLAEMIDDGETVRYAPGAVPESRNGPVYLALRK